MPIEFSTCLERDVVYARWYGDIDFDQFAQNLKRYLGDVHYRPGRPELIDHSGVGEVDLNYRYVQSMLRQVNEQSPDGIVNTHTVIYAPGQLIFGLSRMYQLLAEMAHGIRVEVFQDEGEALEALHLPYSSIKDLLEAETFLPASQSNSEII